jgi:cytochrome c-type biogenesis protein CcmH/NrfG
MIVQRVVVAVVALLAIAWLGVSYGNAHRIRHAQVVAANPKASPSEIDGALRELRKRRTLDPANDAESLSYQASLEIRAGHSEQGLKLLDRVVKLEPDTAEAWFLIAELTAKSDPARSAAAHAELRRLDPLGTSQAK